MPTKKRELEICQMMIECFYAGISAPAAAMLKKVNPKTAYAIYNEIIEQHIQKTAENYYERYEKERIQTIASFDNDISDTKNSLDRIMSEMKSYIDVKSAVPNYMSRNELDFRKLLLDIKDRKSRYSLNPTPLEASKNKSQDLTDD